LSGDDTLTGGAGIDTLIGSADNDTYLVDTTTDTLTENVNEGTDSVFSTVTYTLKNNFENLTLTGTNTINGTGNTLDNRITGNTSNNTLSGSAGIDTLIGSIGNDTYVIDTTTDILAENVNEGKDSVSSSVTYTLGSNLENLTLTGTNTINGTGNTLNNKITGNSSNNELFSDAGNDTLSGGAGIDTLIGGAGNDTYIIDTTTDTLTENANEGTDAVSSSVTYTLGSNLENLTLTGTNTINGTGNTLNNKITGNSSNNILSGDAGNDTLFGGTGSDLFLYDTNTAFTNSTIGSDRITDFSHNNDKIVLDLTTFNALTSIAGNGFSVATEFAVVSNNTAVATASALIVYSSGTGSLFYNQNGTATGLGSGSQFDTLSGIPALGADDFVLQA
jgi:Ca2+-binding RTX toxin-like protein